MEVETGAEGSFSHGEMTPPGQGQQVGVGRGWAWPLLVVAVIFVAVIVE